MMCPVFVGMMGTLIQAHEGSFEVWRGVFESQDHYIIIIHRYGIMLDWFAANSM